MDEEFTLPKRSEDAKARKILSELLENWRHTACIDGSYKSSNFPETHTEKWEAMGKLLDSTFRNLIGRKFDTFLLVGFNWFTVVAGKKLLELREEFPIKIYIICRSWMQFYYLHRNANRFLKEEFVYQCGQADHAFGITKNHPSTDFAEILAHRSAALVCMYGEDNAANQAILRLFSAGFYDREIIPCRCDFEKDGMDT